MTKPTIRHYTYYHCTKRKDPACTQGSIECKELERQIEEFLSRIRISERFKDWVLRYLREIHDQETAARNEMIRSQQSAYEACLKRLDNLVRLKTSPTNADGRLLSDEEYGRQRFDLLKEKARLEELSRDTGQRIEAWLTSAEKIFEFACTAPARFTKGDFATKKEILAAVGSNLTLKDKKLCIEAIKPFVILGKSLMDVAREESRLEPENIGSTERQKEPCGSLSPTGLGERDKVRTDEGKMRRMIRAIYDHFKRSDLTVISPSLTLN
jgi:hypothetical protein